MADTKKRITELPEESSTQGLYTIGVNAQNESVKVPLGDILEAYKADKTKVDKAVADAAAAKTDAADAKTKAQNAVTGAGIAQGLAETANTTANAASTTATEAKTLATTASSDATDAKNDASDALEEATEASATATAAKNSVDPRMFFNANKLLNKDGVKLSLSQVLALIGDDFTAANVYHHGVVLSFLDENGDVANYQYTGEAKVDFLTEDYWKKFGGSAAVGNCFNVTTEVPKSLGYYTLSEAIGVTFDKGYNNLGVQITFCIAENSWKTYQFVGSDTTETTFKNVDKWLDLAGMSAGDEAIINVDYLCGACTAADFYSLEYAIAAISARQLQTGITYAKSGLIITYKTSDTSFETKQFKGATSDFGEAALWSDFGGGSSVETSDDPEKDGEDAFSTGGAYTHLPTDLSVDLSEENILSLALVNAEKEVIGETHQVQIKGGGGGTSGTIVTMYPEHSPLYAKAAGSVILKAAIRSVTTQGTIETLNMIERVEMYDRDTAQLLETFKLNQASSSDKETYDFSFDLSSYFTTASARKFKFVIYDDTDHNGSRNVNVTAVDVTIRSEQTLNYTASTIVTKGGNTKSLPMYRFANNASGSGIQCTTEIYINGSWKTLGVATIADTYSHSISINPQNCCGSVLTHGSYPVRIHGVDIDSGVVGNYLHTSIMVVDPNSTTPIICTRWLSDKQNGTIKQYESISVDFAIYDPTSSTAEAKVYEKLSDGSTTKDTLKQTTTAQRNTTYTYTQRVKDVKTDGSVNINIYVKTGTSTTSQLSDFKVQGSLIDIEAVTTQLLYDLDMESRSNSDADKTIKSGSYELVVTGSNYSSNGFVKDSYGTSEYGTEADKGEMSLRVAENVTGVLNHSPFNNASIEANGMALQFRIRTKHIADDNAKLISCIANGFGFYVTGKNVVFTTDNEATTAHTIVSALNEGTTTDVAIVIEPVSQAPYANIGVCKMYFDGELIGTCYYDSGSLTRHTTQISFNGSEADLYLYNIRAWETYFNFEQDFNNYLLKIKDADAMITEYQFNQVMSSQSAEGKAATNRPQAMGLYNHGLPYFVVCKNADTEDRDDNYPEYLETLDGDKKTTRILDVYAYFPDRPYQDFKAIGVTISNQGTTSSKRPIKNIKMKLKAATITLLHTADEYTGEDLVKFNECKANAAAHKVQVKDDSLPTNIITVKVDYSESGGANNGAMTNLFNDLQRALGSDYRTPAQNAYTGKGTLQTSIDSIPCAFFRTDKYSSDATSPSYGYFHAKGNWNCDKGDAAFYGFEKCDGYNKGCLNYGDFYELVAAKGQTLAAFVASQDKSTWEFAKDSEDPSKGNFNIVVCSEFCGAAYKVFRRADAQSAWADTTGTMTYASGKWTITGDFVNPVECYELLTYDALDWFQGVNSVEDMIADKSGKPQWLTYFESRYPDNDALNDLYEDGKKVPYRLYKWLKFCQDCNQHLTATDGNITLDGSSVSGTPANRLLKWKHELHKEANVHSVFCYDIFTDYLAAVDQRSKNMMIAFYLDTDGQTRMYLNHLYDGDTILGSDNDCGLTIDAELDPNNDTQQKYQGYDSVLFVQNAAAKSVWLNSDGSATLSLASVANSMRNQLLSSGLKAFSPDGLEKYWIKDRLEKWPKLVSSYDGTRKYIEHSTSAANYFYALHGLSVQRLREFIKTRFLFRDGYYQTGDLFSSAIAMRCTGTNMSVKIKAAKKGYFGIGVDRASTAYESVYLDAGEEATLHTDRSSTGGGYMLYIFGANKIEELDISNATPKQSGWDISELVLLKKFVIGGASYTPATTSGEELSTLALGQLPFLEELDIRNFPLTSLNAEFCPRIKKVLATGSSLQTITLAETSPISELTLPASMTNLNFVNLPNLTYPNGSLTIAGLSNVKRLKLSGCAHIDTLSLLQNTISSGATLTEISIPQVDITADATILTALKNAGTKGIGSELDYGCDGITGRWILSSLIADTDLNSLKAYFPELALHNAQFTMFCFDDTISDPVNITNCDNNTSGESYEASGHISRIREKLIPVKGKYDSEQGKWIGSRMSNDNYHNLADGTEFDYTDALGDGFDAMMRFPACWYKGVNDFKNQKKYILWSSLSTQPMSTATKTTRKLLSQIVLRSSSAIIVSNITEGTSTLDSEGVISATANYNLYQIDVEGMKQVRYPAMNNSAIGVCFLNENGVIIKKWNMAISNTMFDFVEGEYVFIDVPTGAKYFVFTANSSFGSLEAIAVDSSAIEAIEPDWVHVDAWLGGIYEASVDTLRQLRSVSGSSVRVGTGTQTTSSEWTYDADGRPTNTPVGNLNYTQKDFQNLAARRGQGFQLFDYEMSKLTALLWFCLKGRRDSQNVCGQGRSAGGTNGYTDSLGNKDSYRGQVSGNKCLGFESFFACTYEWMDNVAVNVASYAQFLKNKCVGTSGVDPIDAKWHIYDPIAKTERIVQGITDSGKCVARLKFGRFCDIIASKMSSDTSTFATFYTDGQYYSADRGRVVGRAGYNSSALGGLVYSNAYYASSISGSNYGSRLAFRGSILIEDE